MVWTRPSLKRDSFLMLTMTYTDQYKPNVAWYDHCFTESWLEISGNKTAQRIDPLTAVLRNANWHCAALLSAISCLYVTFTSISQMLYHRCCCYLGVSTEMMQSPRTDLKVFQQRLDVIAMSSEHVIQHWHSALDERVHKLTTILECTHTNACKHRHTHTP